jgi:hypothetical protein
MQLQKTNEDDCRLNQIQQEINNIEIKINRPKMMQDLKQEIQLLALEKDQA